jgi:arginine decarboxylase
MRTSPPNLLWTTVGHAEGETRLNAFDNALIAAGIGDWNLVKVTSVAPAAARLVEIRPAAESGCVVPVVLASVESDRPGELVTASVGIGRGNGGHGMIMEASGPGDPEQMEASVRRMLNESFMRRGLELETVTVRSMSHTVENVGASVAAVVLWWG